MGIQADHDMIVEEHGVLAALDYRLRLLSDELTWLQAKVDQAKGLDAGETRALWQSLLSKYYHLDLCAKALRN